MQWLWGSPRRVRNAFVLLCAAAAGVLTPPASACAQQRVIHVVGDDGAPVAFANVTLKGERQQITNEHGDVSVGTNARPDAIADIRRLGYEPWYGPVALGDSQMTATVTIHRLTRRMFTVKVTDSSHTVPAYLRGFYERMLARQRGIGTGVYLTPEAVEVRSAAVASGLLQGMNGVSLRRLDSGKRAAMSADGSCAMSVVVDGHIICPTAGCDRSNASPMTPQQLNVGRRASVSPRNSRVVSNDDQFVVLDDIISQNEVAAVEVYARGATIPPGLPMVDSSCGVVVFWTGGRVPP